MNMTNHEISLPDYLKISDFDVKMLIAGKLYEDGRLSAGQACEVVGISKRAFIELLGKYNILYFTNEEDELEEDLNNA